ncbi:MAG TPA: hypothetical protein VNT23_06895 [Gaiellaceae bacterium]|nr:hypothetical protein [Gaiellaceae bacterium]
MPDDVREDALAQGVFRSANETLAERRDELEVDGATPFLCECRRRGCTELVHLDPDLYERIRAEGHRFVVVPGHEQGLPAVEVLERTDGYVVIEKQGPYGAAAKTLDPRRDGDA